MILNSAKDDFRGFHSPNTLTYMAHDPDFCSIITYQRAPIARTFPINHLKSIENGVAKTQSHHYKYGIMDR